MTMVTNPLTIGFWLWLAYQLGSLLLGEPASAPPVGDDPAAWVSAFGLPALLGMGVFALGGAALSYVVVKLAWRVRVRLKRRSRLARAVMPAAQYPDA